MSAHFITRTLDKASRGFIETGVSVPVHLSRKHHSVEPAVIDRLSTAVQSTTFGTRASTRLPQADALSDMYVRVELPAMGTDTYDPYCGLSIIESLVIRVGSHRIFEAENFRAALKAALLIGSKGSGGKMAAYLRSLGSESASGAATSLCIPIPWAFSELVSEGRATRFLPVHLASSGAREITVDITWAALSAIKSGATDTPVITSAELVVHTLVMGPNQLEEAKGMSAFFHHFGELQGFPVEAVALGTNSLDISATRGHIGSVFAFNSDTSLASDGAAFGGDEGAYIEQFNIDGRVHEIAGSAAERAADCAANNFAFYVGDVNGDGTANPAQCTDVVNATLSLAPDQPYVMSGGLAMRDVRSCTFDYVCADAGEVEVCVVGSAAIALENGTFVLLR